MRGRAPSSHTVSAEFKMEIQKAETAESARWGWRIEISRSLPFQNLLTTCRPSPV